MNKLLVAIVASIFIPGVGVAASNPTDVEAETVGPQDSVGTSGTSPTKNLIRKQEGEEAERSGEQGHASEGNSAVPGTFESGQATDVRRSAAPAEGADSSSGSTNGLETDGSQRGAASSGGDAASKKDAEGKARRKDC
jgi:hypothetical protein